MRFWWEGGIQMAGARKHLPLLATLSAASREREREEEGWRAEERLEQQGKHGRRISRWLGAELTLTTHPFVRLARANHKTNTLNAAKRGAPLTRSVPPFFEQTKIKSWRCHIKDGEGMDRSSRGINTHYRHVT